MEIVIDGQKSHAIEGSPKDTYAVVAVITEYLNGLGKGIVSLKIDEELIFPEDLEKKTVDRPVEEVARIEVFSSSYRDLATHTLRELKEVLPELPQACRILAQTFQGENPESGFEPFQQFATAWSHVKYRQSEVVKVLNLDADTLEIDDKTLAEIHCDLNKYLEEAAGAIENRDYILLGDLLEYELAPRAEMEALVVARLAREAGLDID